MLGAMRLRVKGSRLIACSLQIFEELLKELAQVVSLQHVLSLVLSSRESWKNECYTLQVLCCILQDAQLPQVQSAQLCVWWCLPGQLSDKFCTVLPYKQLALEP